LVVLLHYVIASSGEEEREVRKCTAWAKEKREEMDNRCEEMYIMWAPRVTNSKALEPVISPDDDYDYGYHQDCPD
jgi:hypothetical protein